MTTQDIDRDREAFENWLNEKMSRNRYEFGPGDHATCLAAFEAGISHARSEREGWKLVPVEPTPEMINAGMLAVRENGGEGVDDMLATDATCAYEAMIAAAPTADNRSDKFKRETQLCKCGHPNIAHSWGGGCETGCKCEGFEPATTTKD